MGDRVYAAEKLMKKRVRKVSSLLLITSCAPFFFFSPRSSFAVEFRRRSPYARRTRFRSVFTDCRLTDELLICDHRSAKTVGSTLFPVQTVYCACLLVAIAPTVRRVFFSFKTDSWVHCGRYPIFLFKIGSISILSFFFLFFWVVPTVWLHCASCQSPIFQHDLSLWS